MEDRGSQNDEISRGMWEAVKTGTRKVRMGEAERRRGKGRSRKKKRGKGEEEETEKRKNGRS